MPSLGQPVLVKVRVTHGLVPLHAEAGGQEDAGSQGDMTYTLASLVQVGGVQEVVHHHGAHGQVGEEEQQV